MSFRGDVVEYLLEEGGIGFLGPRIIRGEGGIKRIAELFLEEIECPASGVGHRNETVILRETGQRRGAVCKTLPALGGVPQPFAIFLLSGQAELRRDREIDANEVIGKEVGILGVAGCAVEAER